MKSIEERENAFANSKIQHNNGVAWETGYREGKRIGYHFGATEQREITLTQVFRIITDELGRACGTALIKAIQNKCQESGS